MRDNPVRRKLEAGIVPLETMVTQFATSAIVRIAEDALRRGLAALHA